MTLTSPANPRAKTPRSPSSNSVAVAWVSLCTESSTGRRPSARSRPQLVHQTGPQRWVGRDARHLLGPRQQTDAGLAPRGREVERVEGGEAEQDRDRAAVHLGAQGHALGGGVRSQVELTAPRLGVVVVLRQGEGDRTVGGGGQAAHPRHLLLRRGQVLTEGARGRQLEDTGAE